MLSSIAKNFPVANELRTLGYQREGFFAFANGIYNGNWQEVDDIGTTQHKDKMYFSPSFSKIYSQLRDDEDEYKNDRFFVFKKSPITFSQWAELFTHVFGENAKFGISFLLASLFRSIIYEQYKIFPHMFLFGEKQSGKSQFAWSLSNVFFNQMPAFNLNSGTQVGFFRRLSRVKNAICWVDEYTNDIDERRFQSIKSAYDGMGHEKGKMTKDSRTEITEVNSALLISGQYLPTRDDNSVLTRSILMMFEKTNYTSEEIKHFDLLKEYEIAGLSSIVTEILKETETINKYFIRTFADIFESLKNKLISAGSSFDERVVRNMTSLLVVPKIVLDKEIVELPFTYDDLFLEAIDKIIDQTSQISHSEAVSAFWNLVQFMYESSPPLIHNGKDFKIQVFPGRAKTLTVKDKRDKFVEYEFTEPTEVIFFRFTKIHPLYMETHRKQYGKNGVDLTSMLHYVKHHKAYLGRTESTRFNNTVTSAFAFNYDMLTSLNLESEENPDMMNPDIKAPF